MAGYPSPTKYPEGMFFYDLGQHYIMNGSNNRYLYSNRYRLSLAYRSHSIILLKNGQCTWVKNRAENRVHCDLCVDEIKQFLVQQLKSEYVT